MFDYQIRVGTKLRYVSHENKHEGQIINVSFMNDTFTIEWDNKQLIPPTSSYPTSSIYQGHFLILDSQNETQSKVKCTCGVDKVGEGKHSDWCDKYF